MKHYDPFNWYWLVGDDSEHVYSSASNAYLPSDDPIFLQWKEDGSIPTQIDSVESLDKVLAPYRPSVTPRQARLALLHAGLLDQVQAAVDAAGGATKISWEYATTIERYSPLITSIGASLGLTPEQIDVLFKYAATQ